MRPDERYVYFLFIVTDLRDKMTPIHCELRHGVRGYPSRYHGAGVRIAICAWV